MSANPQIKIINNHAYANSLDLAKNFGKRHDHVMREIGRLILSLNAPKIGDINTPQNGLISASFLDNFQRTYYKDSRSRQQMSFNLTKDAFTLVAMSFTGEKALQWKIAYIQEFNRIQNELRHARARIETLEQLEMFPEQLRERKYTIAEVQTKLSNLGLFTPRTSANAIKNAIKRDGSLGRFDGLRWVMNESGLKSYVSRREISA